MVGGEGVDGNQTVLVRHLGLGVGQRRAELGAQRARTKAPHHGRELQRDVHHETDDEDPGPEVVRRVEAEAEDVVVLDVEQPGDHLEDDAADDEDQGQAFEHVGYRPSRGPGEQLGHHRPQLGEDHRDQDEAESDVETLGQLEQPGRTGRPVEVGQVQEPDVGRDGLVELRAVGDPVQKSGQDHQGKRDQQEEAEHRGEPWTTERAPPGMSGGDPGRRPFFEFLPQPPGKSVLGLAGRSALPRDRGHRSARPRRAQSTVTLPALSRPPHLARDHPDK